MGEENPGNTDRSISLERTNVRRTMLEVFTSSAALLDTAIPELEASITNPHLKELPISYRRSFKLVQNTYPNQVVAIFSAFQPDLGPMASGILYPESHILTTRRSDENKWGAGTWTLPMGKIEPSDATSADQSLGGVITSAAHREMNEEVVKRYTGGFMCIANSFLDEETGNLIHVLVNEIGDDDSIHDKSLEVNLPDTREHSDIRWITAQDIPTLSPVTDGTKFAFLMALKFIKAQNKSALESGRYT